MNDPDTMAIFPHEIRRGPILLPVWQQLFLNNMLK